MERPVLKVCGWMSAPGARWTLKRVEMRVERVCCGTIQWSNAGRHSDQGWARGWEGRSDALPFVLCGMRVGRGRGVVQQLAQPVLPQSLSIQMSVHASLFQRSGRPAASGHPPPFSRGKPACDRSWRRITRDVAGDVSVVPGVLARDRPGPGPVIAGLARAARRPLVWGWFALRGTGTDAAHLAVEGDRFGWSPRRGKAREASP